MEEDRKERTPVKCTRCGTTGEAKIVGESYVRGNSSTRCPLCGEHMVPTEAT